MQNKTQSASERAAEKIDEGYVALLDKSYVVRQPWMAEIIAAEYAEMECGLIDADLLLGHGWREALKIVHGKVSDWPQEQISRLACDNDELRDENMQQSSLMAAVEEQLVAAMEEAGRLRAALEQIQGVDYRKFTPEGCPDAVTLCNDIAKEALGGKPDATNS